MADEKKSFDKKPAPASTTVPIETIIGIFLILLIVSALLERIYSFLATGNLSFYGVPLNNISSSFKSGLPLIKTVAFVFSTLAIFGTIIFSQLRGTILLEQKKKLYPEGEPKASGEPAKVKNPMADRWAQVIEHSQSAHPSDWRLAIIEADVMLSELLDVLRLRGETIADKLKSVEPSDFLTLDQAWEAHKIRNQIAHEGSEFLFHQREARRVVGLYQQVFEEFSLI